MAEENNTPETKQQESNILMKRTKALVKDDIFKLEFELFFAYIDTINSI